VPTCPRCGFDNPDGFRFCGSCASPLEERSARRDIRKTVTVVFTDVTGSTNLGDRLDPESMRHVMGRYFEAMKAVLERHGGTVEKFIGDAVMAVFGIPVVHEDDALRAARAAVEMGEALRELNKELERDRGVSIQTRTGVNTGEVVAGDSTTGQTLVTGDAVNVAARLQQAAQPGEILIGAPTYRLVRDAVAVGEARSIEAKGKTEPVRALPLIEVLPGLEGFQRRLDSPMVGRDRERRLVEEAFERAVSERTCHLFTILGSAGVGKSRLVEEALRGIGDRASMLRGRCLPYGEGITFWPVIAVVRDAAGIGEGDLPEAVRSKIAAIVEGEEQGELIGDRVAPIVGVDESGAPADEVFWAVRKLLEALARRTPLVVVFDDIQWGEPTFLDLVEHLADWSRDAPILMVCLARPDLLDRRPTWAGGKMNATSILLEPLTDGEAGALIQNLLGQTSFAESVRTRVLEAAEGNPLFVEQMVSMLIDEGLLERDDGHWVQVGELATLSVPPTIQALLAARLDRLQDEERAVIERASVVGKTFYLGAVAELAPLALRPHVGTHLMSLVRKELVRPDRSDFADEEAFRFRHILIRDAAYEAIPKESRAELHEAFAGWLTSTTGARAKEYEEIIGYHLEQACRYRTELGRLDEQTALLGQQAAHLLGTAGRRARAWGDVRAAANLLDRAARLLPEDSPERLALLPDLGQAVHDAGDFPRADAILTEAIERATRTGARTVEAYASVARASMRIWSQPEGATEEALEVADRSRGLFEELGDDLGFAKAWRLVAETYINGARWVEIGAAAERALEYAKAAGDDYERLYAIGWVGSSIYFGPMPAPEGIARLERLIEEYPHDRMGVEGATLAKLAGLKAMRGEFEEARRLTVRWRSVIEDLGRRVSMGSAAFWTGDVEILAGELEAAERDYRESCRILEAVGDKGGLSSMSSLHADVLYELGNDDSEAERLTVKAEGLAASDDLNAQVFWRAVRAKLLARRGHLEEAARLGREAVELSQSSQSPNDLAMALTALAEVLQAMGEPEEAAERLRQVAEVYAAKGNIVMERRTRQALSAMGPSA
jgi:class 3 adenylate cyclase/tetratricopeptide (TPR) repeat protein